jgi:PTS system cellobiose-specific IIA component
MDERIVNVAMQIILNAGDARNSAMSAMSSEMSGDKIKADEFLLEAKEYVKRAHLSQTEVIQDEASGNKMDISLLFIHAQDTLMTIKSEVSMIEKMIELNRKLEEKISECCK